MVLDSRAGTKAMFLVVTACPRYDSGDGLLFDGKLELRPFLEFMPAKVSTKNRPTGTSEMRTCAANLFCTRECSSSTIFLRLSLIGLNENFGS